ncbi:MAG: PadR family transcriptional regulator [Chitinophagales bacterium]
MNPKILEKLEHAKAQMRRGILEFCILSLLGQEEMYSANIIKALEKNDLIVVHGTLYPLLTRLKKIGLITYRWVESEQGPPRKYYSLTEDGKSFKNELEITWNQLVHTVQSTTINVITPQNISNHEQNS